MTDINGDKTIDVLINEYRVMRGEISLYQRQQNQAINFYIIAFIGVLTVVFRDIASSIGRDITAVALLVLPIFILVAGLLYVDRTMRIDRIGRYIHNVLRVQLIDLCGHDVLLWESCKRVLIEEAGGLRKIILWMLERVRLLMFVLLFFNPILHACRHLRMARDCMERDGRGDLVPVLPRPCRVFCIRGHCLEIPGDSRRRLGRLT